LGAATLASLLLGKSAPSASTLPSRNRAAPADGAATPQSLLEDLRGRLERARATPAGPRRAALLVALRYRINVERDKLASADDRAAISAIEAEALGL
ncbi:hypothetical protein SE17_30550, partial [Kouleothrix aurantiaca]